VKFTARCKHCPKEFHNNAEFRLRANIGNHMRSAHPEHYQPTPAAEAKREWVKNRKKAVDKPTAVRKVRKQPVALVKYCPNCGCNIHAVSVAMGL